MTWLIERLRRVLTGRREHQGVGHGYFLSAVRFPAGPTYRDFTGSDEHSAWVRYKVWAGDWYTATLQQLREELGSYDRYLGVEMALDGALGSLSGAFDAAVGVLIEAAEAEVLPQNAPGMRPWDYSWKAFTNLIRGTSLETSELAVAVRAEVEEAMETRRGEAIGWLASMRRLRNRPTHHGTIPRVHDLDPDTNQLSVTGFVRTDSDPVAYLKASCDRVALLTERMLALASSYHYVGANTVSSRNPWGIY